MTRLLQKNAPALPPDPSPFRLSHLTATAVAAAAAAAALTCKGEQFKSKASLSVASQLLESITPISGLIFSPCH